jgi:hypothetical protein
MKNVCSMSIAILALLCLVVSAGAGELQAIGRVAGMDPVGMTKQVSMGTMNMTKRVNMATMNMTQMVTSATLNMTRQVNMATLNMTKHVNMGSLTMTKSIFQNPSRAVSNFKAFSLDTKNKMVQEKEALEATNAKYINQQKANKAQAEGYVAQDRSDFTNALNAD